MVKSPRRRTRVKKFPDKSLVGEFDMQVVKVYQGELTEAEGVYTFVQLDGEPVPKEQLDDVLSRLARAVSKELALVRQRLSILLNTSGGDYRQALLQMREIDDLVKQGRRVDVYGLGAVGSAGAFIFAAPSASSRHILGGIDTYWHAPAPVQGVREFPPTEQYLRQYDEWICQILTPRLNSVGRREVLARYKRALDDPDNLRAEFTISGQEMSDMGYAIAYPCIDEIERAFLDNTGWVNAGGNRSVGSFFDLFRTKQQTG